MFSVGKQVLSFSPQKVSPKYRSSPSHWLDFKVLPADYCATDHVTVQLEQSAFNSKCDFNHLLESSLKMVVALCPVVKGQILAHGALKWLRSMIVKELIKQNQRVSERSVSMVLQNHNNQAADQSSKEPPAKRKS